MANVKKLIGSFTNHSRNEGFTQLITIINRDNSKPANQKKKLMIFGLPENIKKTEKPTHNRGIGRYFNGKRTFSLLKFIVILSNSS